MELENIWLRENSGNKEAIEGMNKGKYSKFICFCHIHV